MKLKTHKSSVLVFTILTAFGVNASAFFGGGGCYSGIHEVTQKDVAEAMEKYNRKKEITKVVDLQAHGAKILKNELLCYADYDYSSCRGNIFRYDYRAVIRCTSAIYVDTQRIKNGKADVKKQEAVKLANEILKKSGFQKFSKIGEQTYYFKSVDGIKAEEVALFHKKEGSGSYIMTNGGYSPKKVAEDFNNNSGYEIYEFGKDTPVVVYKDPAFVENGEDLFDNHGTDLSDLNKIYRKALNADGEWYYDGRVGVLLKK